MNLPTEKTQIGKVRIVVKGQDSFRTTAASMIIASGFEPDPNNVAVIDTNSNYNKLFAGWGFHNLVQLNYPCTLEKMLGAIESCETKKVLVIDSIDSFLSTLMAIHSRENETGWESIVKSWRKVIARLMLGSCHVIVSLKVRDQMMEDLDVFGLEEILPPIPASGLGSDWFEDTKALLSKLCSC